MQLRKTIGNVLVTSPAPREVWHEVASTDPNCLIFQTPAWTDAICSTGQYEDVSRLYEESGRKWVLPLLQKKGGIQALAYQSSLPAGWGLGGLISNTPIHPEIVRTVFADLELQTALRTLIRPNPLLTAAWEAGKPPGTTTLTMTTHLLDLTGGFDAVWKNRFHHPTRTSVHKAERSGLTVEVDREGTLLPVYYDIFTRWSLRRGKERHLPRFYTLWVLQRRDPLSRLQKMFENSGGAGRLYIASLNQRPVAAAILFIFKQNAIYLRGTSIREEAGPVRANDLLQCMMIKDACQAGCRYYHMGTSAGIESLMRFKEGFGAEPAVLYNYSVERLPVSRFMELRNSLVRSVENQLIRIKTG